MEKTETLADKEAANRKASALSTIDKMKFNYKFNGADWDDLERLAKDFVHFDFS